MGEHRYTRVALYTTLQDNHVKDADEAGTHINA
jgi:hypothetical protein